ncbi:hypothetical protein THAR02_10159 [Trichoderma harzianum]|uniref:Nephrocystin 3-like N-terminal domain-containing protein n=1 Tax=Trichoderma harzianum TaxID=5544 RepID=A0A0F9XAG6_TRIHA|nr:hypothetical protein THAR02_10159 [Trichoderma harzianum]
MERQDRSSFWRRISNANHVQPSHTPSQSQDTAESAGNNGQLRKGRFSSLFLGKDRGDKSRNHSNESVIEEKRSVTVKFGSLKLPEADRDPWIEAYEQLRNDEKEGKLVNAYEKILTNRATATISGTRYVDDVQADAPNQFEGLTEADRVDMMTATLNPGLEKAKQEKTWKNVALYADALIIKDILAEVKKVNEAASRAEKTRAAERRDDLVGLISRFGATTYRDQMEFNPQRHPGTCCGKSVLARFLVETELPSQREDAVIGYFFKDNPVQNNLINALSAILHQLLNLCPDVIDTLGTNIKKLSPELLKDCGHLWGLIEDACENLSERTVFCVFDAFDECVIATAVKDCTDRRHVETLLRLIYVAKEPLSMGAANVAVNIRGKYSLDSLEDLGLSDEKAFKEWVINTCGFFITDYDGKLFFIHQTAKEFLSPVMQTPMDRITEENTKAFSFQTILSSTELLPKNAVKWRGSINTEEEAHLVMTECCLANLSIYRQRPETKELEALIEDAWEHDQTVYDDGIRKFRRRLGISDDFFNYSSTYWSNHFRAAKLHLVDLSADSLEIGDTHQIAKQSLFQAYRLIMTYPTRSAWMLSPDVMAEVKFLMKRHRSGRLLTKEGPLYIADISKSSNDLEIWPSTTLFSIQSSPLVFACLLGFPLFIQEWLSDNAQKNATQVLEQKCRVYSSEAEIQLALANAIVSNFGTNQERECCISEILDYEAKFALDNFSRLERLLRFGDGILDAVSGYVDEVGMRILTRGQLKKFKAMTRPEDKLDEESVKRKPRRAETT